MLQDLARLGKVGLVNDDLRRRSGDRVDARDHHGVLRKGLDAVFPQQTADDLSLGFARDRRQRRKRHCLERTATCLNRRGWEVRRRWGSLLAWFLSPSGRSWARSANSNAATADH